jgi:DNA-binding protein H-NS
LARARTLKQIRAQISALQSEAQRLEKLESPGIAKVAKLIRAYNLTAADLESALMSANARRGKSDKRRKVPVKYRDKNGNEWSGRGLTPRWLVAAERAGQKRDKFLVKTTKNPR